MRKILVALALIGQAAGAQGGTPVSGALPPIRTLGKTLASSTELLGAVSQARALPDGRLLVNDNSGRKVVLFDKELKSYTIVADTTSATANAYSSRAAGLITYKGDSTLFVDPQSLSMLVIDGKGAVTRVMSVPRPNEAQALIGGPNGTPGFDAQGRLVYRAPPDMQRMMQRAMGGAQPGQPGFTMPQLPDSMTLVRIDLESRKIDTVGNVKIYRPKMTMSGTPETGMRISSPTNPLFYLDDWAVLADGRVAIVRGQEYKVEYINAAGQVESSSKLPFQWVKLSDSMKVAILDSAKAVAEKNREEAMKRIQQGGAGAPIVMGPGGGAAPAMGDRMVMEFRVGGDAGGRGGRGGEGGANRPAGAQQITLPPIEMVSPSEVPDYAPPFTAGAARGDADGNLWIRTTMGHNGGAVYDVVNAKGQLTDRVLVPTGRFIAGFGPGVVYMGVRDGTGVRLEVASIRDGSTIATKH